MITNNRRYSAILIGLVIVTSVWGVHFLALFALPNGVVYDYVTRHALIASPSSQLLVIEGNRQAAENGDEIWIPVLKNLLAKNVKQVVFNFLPTRVSADFYQLAAQSGKVVFGQQVVSNTPYLPANLLQVLPVAAIGKNIALGVLSTPPSEYGVYRKQHHTVVINGQRLPTLEYSAAQRALGNPMTLTSDDYRINFFSGTAKIPKVELAQAVADSLIDELITERTVFVGIYGVDPVTHYFTPLATDSEPTPDVLFHALALNTLLAKQAISTLEDWRLLLVIISITLFTLIFCQCLAFRRTLVVSLLLTLCYGVLCWLCLHTVFLWIPLCELLLAQWLTFIIVWRYRIKQENLILESTLFNLSINLQEKAFPVSFHAAHDPWTQLIVMINESLHLNRMIFLERIPNEHRLKEIKAFQCNIDDVLELRRDYERTPYSTAIHEHQPILQTKPYLKPLAIEEQQYLAPLIFAGDVLGFWAFSIELNKLTVTPKFLALTQAYMAQISEILYYRQEWQKHTAQENSKFWSYLSFNTGEKSYITLNKSVALLDRRLAELQQVFNSLNTGGVLYDLFGRVLLLNKYMEELAQSVDLKLYSMTALEFIMAVTGYDAIVARNLMQKAIFDRETLAIPVANFKEERDYVLHIQPLKLIDNEHLITGMTPVFQVTGILCELEDVTELKAIYRLKEQIFERFSCQLRNDLTTMASNLASLISSTTEQNAVLTSMQTKVTQTLDTLNAVNQQMLIDVESLTSSLGRYPINGQDGLKKACAALKSYAATRFIKLHLQTPPLMSLVFASPIELYAVFYTLLTAIIDDTFEGADVWVTSEQTDESTQYYFHNNGIGIANNKLQTLNGNTSADIIVESLKMDEVLQYLKHWDAHMDINSEVGKGSTITLSLKRFL